MVNAGEFPRQFRISKRIAAWLASEIAAWQTAQLASRERDGKAA
jgi:predicted DNA-binding transcriptional regulator AlpA